MNEFIEMLYPDQAGGFSENMYNYGLYATMFGMAAATALLMVVLFYYVINSPRFNKRVHWFMMMAVVAVFNFCFVSVIQYPADVIYEGNNAIHPLGDWLVYGAMHTFWTILLFTAFSFGLKWWSRNCKTTPF
jgi:hypothetical protein